MVLKRAEEAAGDGAKNADPPAELLIVEDEPEGAGLYQRMLETAGYESNINDSITEALDVVDGDYSVVLLDRRLPDGTGPELLAGMRDRELDVVVRELTNEHEMRAFHVPLISVFRDTAQAVRSSDVSFHASEFETSMMLELFPELVQMDRAEAVDVPDDALPLTD